MKHNIDIVIKILIFYYPFASIDRFVYYKYIVYSSSYRIGLDQANQKVLE